MALIEYDVYKQKLRDLSPELEKLSAALGIESARQEAARLEKAEADRAEASAKKKLAEAEVAAATKRKAEEAARR